MTDHQPQYTVLARRFRPQKFDDVVGQQHVGQSLRNAIAAGRVAHAYLFTGARGVGKTSTARIFAKALNCPNAVNGDPCNACDVCDAIGSGNDVDVLEIDGASNRGIDDIRQLRANVNVRSMRLPTKVYIIDEVHMLTKEAFNALLKTLEEPPPNVKFIFCTTEPNKVPDTILSRCQRFDFGTIASEGIQTRLQEIAQAEGRDVEPEAIELVARRATGSMRDSQSLFDQLLAFGGDVIRTEDVHQLLGTAPDERLIQLLDAIIDGDRAQALGTLEAALNEGVQLASFSDQILQYLRDLLVTASGADSVPLTAVSERSRVRAKEQSDRWGLQTVAAAMQIMAEAKAKMQRVNYGRALLELAIIRMTLLEDLEAVASLVRQIAQGGAAPALPAARPSRPAEPNTEESAKKKDDQPTQQVTPPAPPRPVAPREEPQQPVTTSTATVVECTADTVDAFWAQFLVNAPDSIAAQLKNVSRVALVDGNLLEVTFPSNAQFKLKFCERPDTTKRLRDMAAELAGRPLSIRFQLAKADGKSVAPVAPPSNRQPVREKFAPNCLDEDQFVQNAMTIFGGKVEFVRAAPIQVIAVQTESGEDGPVDEELDD
ncbi:MAG: DNA polymerase III subunit gamma/tau [Planctomycetaceae bacterium]